MNKTINVVGLGYIGLTTSLMFAKSGLKIIGTDINSNLVSDLNSRKLSFKEKGMNEVFNSALSNGIEFTTEYKEASAYIIAVPTPFNTETKRLNTEYILKAINNVLDVCPKGSIIIIESTVSPGTIKKHVRPLIEKRNLTVGKDVHLCHAPERIIPGNMVYELENNSRIIGCDNIEVGKKVKGFYARFCKGDITLTNIQAAEMSKVVENTYRDINIAFANELTKICNQNGLDVYEVIEMVNKHPRVNVLQPGPGVGGHCISVDPWFLVGDYPDLTPLIHTARKVNNSMPEYVLEKIDEIMRKNNIKDYSKIGLYGMTYKENIDDTRESPTLQLIEVLKNKNINNVLVYDPFIKEKVIENQVINFEEFYESIDVIVIMVGHDELKAYLPLIQNKIILDTKNVVMNEGIYKL